MLRAGATGVEKRCCKCGEWLPLESGFYRNRSTSDGRRNG